MTYHSKLNNIDIDIYKTNDFKLNDLSIIFIDDSKKYNSATYKLLCSLLSLSNKKYTKEELTLIRDSNFGSKVSFSCSVVNNVAIFLGNISYINASFAPNLLDKNLKLLFELLEHPKMHNGLFDEEYFNECKDILIHKKKESISDKIGFAIDRYNQIIDKELGINGNNYSLEQLQSVTNKEASDCYLDIIKKHVYVCGCGNFDIKKIKHLLKDKFKNNKFGFNFEKRLKTEINNVDNIIEYAENANQSVVIKLYRYDNDAELGKREFRLYNDILGGSNGRLFNIVREGHGLCYIIQSTGVYYTSSILVFLTCMKDDVDKALELTDEIVNDIKNNGVTQEEADREISLGLADYDSMLESSGSILTCLYVNYLHNQKWSVKKLKEKFKQTKLENINEVGKNMKPFFTYCLINKE